MPRKWFAFKVPKDKVLRQMQRFIHRACTLFCAINNVTSFGTSSRFSHLSSSWFRFTVTSFLLARLYQWTWIPPASAGFSWSYPHVFASSPKLTGPCCRPWRKSRQSRPAAFFVGSCPALYICASGKASGESYWTWPSFVSAGALSYISLPFVPMRDKECVCERRHSVCVCMC